MADEKPVSPVVRVARDLRWVADEMEASLKGENKMPVAAVSPTLNRLASMARTALFLVAGDEEDDEGEPAPVSKRRSK